MIIAYLILNFIIMRTLNLCEINNKSNGLGVLGVYVTTCVTNKLQMNPVHLQQFFPIDHFRILTAGLDLAWNAG